MIKQINELGYVYHMDDYNPSMHENSISKTELKRIRSFIKDIGLKSKCIYVDTRQLSYPIYFDGTVLLEISGKRIDKTKPYTPSLKDSFLANLHGEKVDPKKYKTEYECYKNDFLNAHNRDLRVIQSGIMQSTHLNNHYKVLCYCIAYEYMNSYQKFDQFFNIYKHFDRVLDYFTEEEIVEISKGRPNDIVLKRKEYDVCVDGIIEVYRGEESKSNTTSKAISWTTDYNTAVFFASRFTEDGVVKKGKVKIEDVIYMYDYEHDSDDDYEDPEKEVVVKPNTVFDIKEIMFKL